MDRSAVKALKRKGLLVSNIAEQMGMNRKTVSKILQEPTEAKPQVRNRSSAVDAYSEQIRAWLGRGVPIKRMLELAREADPPFTGGRSEFYRQVEKIRKLVKAEEQEVFVRFEGLAGEYCQVDWGEIRNLHFGNGNVSTRYFFCARLKFSRLSFVRFTSGHADGDIPPVLAAGVRKFRRGALGLCLRQHEDRDDRP
jgi:transposase